MFGFEVESLMRTHETFAVLASKTVCANINISVGFDAFVLDVTCMSKGTV